MPNTTLQLIVDVYFKEFEIKQFNKLIYLKKNMYSNRIQF